MARPLRGPELSDKEQRELAEQHDEQRQKQPYATELDQRELEHAHKDKRPMRDADEGTASADKPER